MANLRNFASSRDAVELVMGLGWSGSVSHSCVQLCAAQNVKSVAIEMLLDAHLRGLNLQLSRPKSNQVGKQLFM